MNQKIKDRIADVVYLLYKYKIVKNKIRVYSVDETLDQLINTEKSLVRFGDGEITMIRGRSLKLQNVDEKLIEDLKRILTYEHEELMVSIPDIFDGVEQYHARSRQFWKDHLLFSRKIYEKYCRTDRVYCSTSVSRCYYAYEDKTPCAGWFQRVRQIWKGKKVVVVEGSRSHNGVGNNLLDLAESVERIICPPSNAYAKLDEIRETCLKYPKDRLFLLALGAAAKPLAESLFAEGYRVIDIGNLDMEYEWFLQGTTEKVKLSKHSVEGDAANRQAGFEKYLNEVAYTLNN